MSELSGEVLGAGNELGPEEPVPADALSGEGGRARRDDGKKEPGPDQPWAKTSSGDEEQVTEEVD